MDAEENKSRTMDRLNRMRQAEEIHKAWHAYQDSARNFEAICTKVFRDRLMATTATGLDLKAMYHKVMNTLKDEEWKERFPT